MDRKEYWKHYYQKNKDILRKKNKIWNEENPSYKKSWSQKNRHKWSTYFRTYRKKMRLNIIEKYGGQCKCCGEKRIEFLAIDHINGGGNNERKTMHSTTLLHYLRKNYLPEKYQILCMNCNYAKSFYGLCPHKS